MLPIYFAFFMYLLKYFFSCFELYALKVYFMFIIFSVGDYVFKLCCIEFVLLFHAIICKQTCLLCISAVLYLMQAILYIYIYVHYYV